MHDAAELVDVALRDQRQRRVAQLVRRVAEAAPADVRAGRVSFRRPPRPGRTAAASRSNRAGTSTHWERRRVSGRCMTSHAGSMCTGSRARGERRRDEKASGTRAPSATYGASGVSGGARDHGGRRARAEERAQLRRRAPRSARRRRGRRSLPRAREHGRRRRVGPVARLRAGPSAEDRLARVPERGRPRRRRREGARRVRRGRRAALAVGEQDDARRFAAGAKKPLAGIARERAEVVARTLVDARRRLLDADDALQRRVERRGVGDRSRSGSTRSVSVAMPDSTSGIDAAQAARRRFARGRAASAPSARRRPPSSATCRGRRAPARRCARAGRVSCASAGCAAAERAATNAPTSAASAATSRAASRRAQARARPDGVGAPVGDRERGEREQHRRARRGRRAESGGSRVEHQ